MKIKTVKKNEDISNVLSNTFVFCNELNKGFIKRDISSLSAVTMEGVISEIENLSNDQLTMKGLDSVIFDSGEISISTKLTKIVETMITEMPVGTTQDFISSMITTVKNKRPYFNVETLKFSEVKEDVEEVIKEMRHTLEVFSLNGIKQDKFGGAVAINDTHILVGAHYVNKDGLSDDDTEISNSGAVYVYDMDGSNELKIEASDAAKLAEFGNAVALSDAYIYVGAPRYSTNFDESEDVYMGRVYRYDLDGSNELKIEASDKEGTAFFGENIVVSGDKLIVAATGVDYDNKHNVGAVYVYDLDGSNEIKIQPNETDLESYELFGTSIATDNNKIVVGAPRKDSSVKDTGAVYVYDMDGSNELKIESSSDIENTRFGSSVAIGNNKIVVGARNKIENSGGAVYVYDLDGSNELKIDHANIGDTSAYGGTLCLMGDKILVSAEYDDGYTGSVYMYDMDGSNETKIKSDDKYDYIFGESIAAYNNIVVIGATAGHSATGVYSGNVLKYTFE